MGPPFVEVVVVQEIPSELVTTSLKSVKAKRPSVGDQVP
jgi:hypothetical protein